MDSVHKVVDDSNRHSYLIILKDIQISRINISVLKLCCVIASKQSLTASQLCLHFQQLAHMTFLEFTIQCTFIYVSL